MEIENLLKSSGDRREGSKLVVKKEDSLPLTYTHHTNIPQ